MRTSTASVLTSEMILARQPPARRQRKRRQKQGDNNERSFIQAYDASCEHGSRRLSAHVIWRGGGASSFRSAGASACTGFGAPRPARRRRARRCQLFFTAGGRCDSRQRVWRSRQKRTGLFFTYIPVVAAVHRQLAQLRQLSS